MTGPPMRILFAPRRVNIALGLNDIGCRTGREKQWAYAPSTNSRAAGWPRNAAGLALAP